MTTPAWATELLSERQDSLRASFIRANQCRFADRYTVSDEEPPLGEGASGKVKRCADKLSRAGRAVKAIPAPRNEKRLLEMRQEINALVQLDHPHIVRLIEYFAEDGQLLLVMELLRGPTLDAKMQQMSHFGEQLAARCVRHMLKALLCCHCNGITHSDVSTSNFIFESPETDACLKMVDLGLSRRYASDSVATHARQEEPMQGRADEKRFAQARDVWGVGMILFAMLAGTELYPQTPTSGAATISASGYPSAAGPTGASPDCGAPNRRPFPQPGSQWPGTRPFSGDSAGSRMACRTDLTYVPRRVRALAEEVSDEARDLLEGLLKASASSRLSAREALMQPFITRFHMGVSGCPAATGDEAAFTLQHCVEGLQMFMSAPRLKRLALLVVAHLLPGTTVKPVHWFFRYLSGDGHAVDENRLRRVLAEAGEVAPEDLTAAFQSADVDQSGHLSYNQFLAAALAAQPSVYCREETLQAVFRFLDKDDEGTLSDTTVTDVFGALAMCKDGELISEACGAELMAFAAFKAMMVPEGWDLRSAEERALWADAPDMIYDPTWAKQVSSSSSNKLEVRNQVQSDASEIFTVCQRPSFHSSALRPFYASLPVSNVVMGIVRWTSSYVRGASALGLVEILEVGSGNGAFFIMPNPKYHVSLGDIPIGREEAPRLRFVAWWIHPAFVAELRAGCGPHLGLQRDGSNAASECSTAGGTEANGVTGAGEPGDFGYSAVLKPSGYLHTYRDLVGVAHADLVCTLITSVRCFLARLLGDARLASARISAGFHYPVRPQYSTLHLQLRVNAGEVCGGKENRGVDIFALSTQLKEDPESLGRDDETLRYLGTENLRLTVLAAAHRAEREVLEVGPSSLILT